jgi:Glyoxalase-like domain
MMPAAWASAGRSAARRPTLHSQSRGAIRSARDAVDHLLLGVADLDRGIEWFEARTGVRAIPGGVHPGRGTRNALASLGDHQYLEIIAPDPAQHTYAFPIDLRTLPEPGLVTWAASTSDINATAAALRRNGCTVEGPADGSRARPDGTRLRWRTVSVSSAIAGAGVDPIPFFIEWDADVVHPSADSPGGCRLVGFDFEHPQADELRKELARLNIDTDVRAGANAVLRATLESPKGPIVLS